MNTKTRMFTVFAYSSSNACSSNILSKIDIEHVQDLLQARKFSRHNGEII
ncbi:MAG: hypothetical protein M3P08_15620 [Thermoproteota archaeon]|jgi:hypothetical protein|nr:hypothetical protein [Thermoproteota archaeon]